MKHPDVNKIIDHLEHLDNSEDSPCGFDMNFEADARDNSKHPCGSACCIGGHAALLLGNEEMCPEDALSQFCDIPSNDAEQLCWPGRRHEVTYALTTLEDVLPVLRHYRDTGEIDWSAVVTRQRGLSD